jgi:hypothetical protein
MAKDADAKVARKPVAAVSVDGDPQPQRVKDPQEPDHERLRNALDTLDEKIKLLLARHTLLLERARSAVAARREAEERLVRLSADELDPALLEQRTRELEAENERLSRHAAYLEDRIVNLLTRVRYVVES